MPAAKKKVSKVKKVVARAKERRTIGGVISWEIAGVHKEIDATLGRQYRASMSCVVTIETHGRTLTLTLNTGEEMNVLFVSAASYAHHVITIPA